METCDKHDDCIVVYSGNLRDCPMCRAEEERDEAQDMLKEAEAEVADLKESLKQETEG
jgi:hypothetical protein